MGDVTKYLQKLVMGIYNLEKQPDIPKNQDKVCFFYSNTKENKTNKLQ